MQNVMGWPTETWDLTAPESHVLLHGVQSSDTMPFKLAVMELVTKGMLSTVEVRERAFLHTRKTSVLVGDPGRAAPTDSISRAVWDLYTSSQSKTFANGVYGVPVPELAKAALKRYSNIGQFTLQVVLPRLRTRGLMHQEDRKVLGLIPTKHYVLSPQGQERKHDLQRRIDLANAEMAGWVANDPRRAVGYVALAGASLLLVPALFPELRTLRDRLQAPGSSAGSDATTYAGSSGSSGGDDSSPTPLPDSSPGIPATPSPTPLPELSDLSSFDFGSLEFSLDAFDSLDSAFDAIDSGVDSGAGSSGDGGGGDGGGGGGD